MIKRFLCGVMAAALVVSAVPVTASAASVPKAKYTFNMNKKSSKVVAVARKGDSSSYTVDTNKNKGGVLPSTAQAKKQKVKLKYVKGKKGKALFLDRKSSYGVELKGIKLGSKSWTVSFWMKASNTPSSYMSMFFTGNNITNTKKTKWVSITKTGDGWLNGFAAPAIWSHSVSGKTEQFPWFAYQDAEGTWKGDKDDAKAMAVKANKWVYITLVVDTKDTCEYGTAGEDGYVKSYHGWLYVNGALYGNGTIAKGTMSNSNKFYLGINAWDTPFKGYFDEVQFWNKALTAKQVKKLYKSKK